MPQSGKQLVLGMFLLAAAFGAFAVGFHWYTSRRVMSLWGPEAAECINRATQMELWELSSDPLLNPLGKPVEPLRRYNVSQARGILNVRHALLEQATFDWSDSAPFLATRTWCWALSFRTAGSKTLVLFSYDLGMAGPASGLEQVPLKPAARDEMQMFVKEQTGVDVSKETVSD